MQLIRWTWGYWGGWYTTVQSAVRKALAREILPVIGNAPYETFTFLGAGEHECSIRGIPVQKKKYTSRLGAGTYSLPDFLAHMRP